MKQNKNYNFSEYTMRLITIDDFENYYRNGFEQTSEEVDYFTGTKQKYSKEAVKNYVESIVCDENRYDFIIIDADEEIVGEVVLNEKEGSRCNYRIAIFNSRNFSKGIGYNASKCITGCR